TTGKLPETIKYHLEWTTGSRSTDYARLDKGDRKDALYEPPRALHEFPYPLAAKDKDGGGGKSGSRGLAAEVPASEHKGSVRVVAAGPDGVAVAPGWAPYHIVCRPKMEVLSGKLDLRDPNGSACPRRAEAALSVKTNVAGPVPFSLDC